MMWKRRLRHRFALLIDFSFKLRKESHEKVDLNSETKTTGLLTCFAPVNDNMDHLCMT